MKPYEYISASFPSLFSLNFSLKAWVFIALLMPCSLPAKAQPMSPLGTPVMPQLTVPSCSVTAGPSLMDFGARTRGQLENVVGGMSPDKRSLTVNAGCTVAREMKLRFSGAARGNQFSWGGTDSELRVRVRQARLDGNAVQLQRLNNAGSLSGEPADEVDILPEQMLVAVVHGQPITGRQLSVMVDIVPVFGEKDTHPVARMHMDMLLSVALMK